VNRSRVHLLVVAASLVVAPLAGSPGTSLAAPAMAPSSRPRPVAAVPCDPLPGSAPQILPRALDSVGLNFTNDMLEPGDSASIDVCALVDTLGIVREARVARGGTPYDSAAVDAVRWWWFRPAQRDGHAVPARVAIHVMARPPRDADPLTPDVFAMALAAEAEGNTGDAIDAWTGALARHGAHPAVGNEWIIRERIARLAVSMREPPVIPLSLVGKARGAHNLMLRDISRATNADLADQLDDVLKAVPWYPDAYRWRASARAASGQIAGAVRDVLCYRLVARDSLGRAVADRALTALVKGDTLAALSMLKY